MRGVSAPLFFGYPTVVEHDPQTGLFVGFVPGFPGARSQGATLDERHENLRDVMTMLLEVGDPQLESVCPRSKTLPLRLTSPGRIAPALAIRPATTSQANGSGGQVSHFPKIVLHFHNPTDRSTGVSTLLD